MKALHLLILLTIALGQPTFAQATDTASGANRPLLTTFCDAANIQGATCTRARNYRAGKRCDVKLEPGRYSGKFLADDTTLLVVTYQSSCEPHATDFGGSVIFAQKDGVPVFEGYQPGFQVNDCIVIPRNEKQDRLICITGHMGQGVVESGVAEMVFTRDFGRTIVPSLNFFVTGEDTVGAYGSNLVECMAISKFFGFARLRAGPGRETVAVDIAHADTDTIQSACSKRLPQPKETYRDLGDGEAYVPKGYEKTAGFVIDLTTSKVVPEADVAKP